MAKGRSRRLVIDADVVQSAGDLGATAPRSRACYDFLMGVRRVCHRILLSPELEAEWARHASRFSIGWQRSMVAIGKSDLMPITRSDAIRGEIEAAAPDEHIAKIMLKDAHLIDAALAADLIIISLDDAVRHHFANASSRVAALRGIAWVNPNDDPGLRLRWLEGGAKVTRAMTLGRRRG